eukprot:scaffold72815_cov86-Phaeocystis_antarctica.AAC.3
MWQRAATCGNVRQRAARCGEMITVENGEIWCGEIDLTPVRKVGAEGKGPIRGPRTYALIPKGSAVRSADHGRQTPRDGHELAA